MFKPSSSGGANDEPEAGRAGPEDPNTAPPPQLEHDGKTLPFFSHSSGEDKGERRTVHKPGESGRRGVHIRHFFQICFRSSCTMSKWVNVLWPAVPVAIALHFALPEQHLAIFITSYIAMVPAANLIGFAGQELARKMPKVIGVIMETTLGSLVEIILFIILVVQGDTYVRVVKAAILGSILANLLLCLGACFIAGGLRHQEQEFAPVVSEVGSGLMLVAGMGLVIPAAFSAGLTPANDEEFDITATSILKLSRATAILLLISYLVYLVFQTRSHHGLFDSILEEDEEKDRDKERDAAKKKLTITECLLALAIALACVSMIAFFLVLEIEWIVKNRGISDSFMGLILIPLVEKASEHLTAIDEAWDNQANFALAHVLGSSIQTALLNTPIVVIVGWGLGVSMDLNFYTFDSVVLILAIIVVGNFLRDGKSNYLEGSLCVLVYVLIAAAAYLYPDFAIEDEIQEAAAAFGPAPVVATSTAAARLAARTLLALRK